MSENKRFMAIGGSLHDTSKVIGDGECMGIFLDNSECKNVCDLLNEQNERIKELEESILNCLFNDVSIGEIAIKLRLVDGGDI